MWSLDTHIIWHLKHKQIFFPNIEAGIKWSPCCGWTFSTAFYWNNTFVFSFKVHRSFFWQVQFTHLVALVQVIVGCRKGDMPLITWTNVDQIWWYILSYMIILPYIVIWPQRAIGNAYDNAIVQPNDLNVLLMIQRDIILQATSIIWYDI